MKFSGNLKMIEAKIINVTLSMLSGVEGYSPNTLRAFEESFLYHIVLIP
jgi:hypothetical protein